MILDSSGIDGSIFCCLIAVLKSLVVGMCESSLLLLLWDCVTLHNNPQFVPACLPDLFYQDRTVMIMMIIVF